MILPCWSLLDITPLKCRQETAKEMAIESANILVENSEDTKPGTKLVIPSEISVLFSHHRQRTYLLNRSCSCSVRHSIRSYASGSGC